MLVFDFYAIGNKLLSIRKRMGLTQSEVAEAAGISDRTYADIEICALKLFCAYAKHCTSLPMRS